MDSITPGPYSRYLRWQRIRRPLTLRTFHSILSSSWWTISSIYSFSTLWSWWTAWYVCMYVYIYLCMYIYVCICIYIDVVKTLSWTGFSKKNYQCLYVFRWRLCLVLTPPCPWKVWTIFLYAQTTLQMGESTSKFYIGIIVVAAVIVVVAVVVVAAVIVEVVLVVNACNSTYLKLLLSSVN